MNTIYLVSFGLDAVRIISVEVVKETPKRIRVDPDTAKIVSGPDARWPSLYVREQINKDKQRVFASVGDAQEWAMEVLQSRISVLASDLERKRALLVALQEDMAKAAMP